MQRHRHLILKLEACSEIKIMLLGRNYSQMTLYTTFNYYKSYSPSIDDILFWNICKLVIFYATNFIIQL